MTLTMMGTAGGATLSAASSAGGCTSAADRAPVRPSREPPTRLRPSCHGSRVVGPARFRRCRGASTGSSPANCFRNTAAVTAPAGRPPVLRHVGGLALQLLEVVVGDRHRPEAITGRPLQVARPRLVKSSGAAEQAAVSAPERNDARAPVSVATSTRCVAPSCCAYSQAVAQNQPASRRRCSRLPRFCRPRPSARRQA